MSFVEFRFLWFFLGAFVVYWTLRHNAARKFWLLVCSYAFYSAWNWKFLFLLLGSTLVDYTVGMMIGRTSKPAVRRGWLLLSLGVNLGTLAFFKYFNFFAGSGAEFLAWLGLPASYSTLSIILPVGVSFYTFQSMSYTIDVYRGRLRAVSSLLDLSFFIAFFPQLVAGPIVRASTFLPQLAASRRFATVDVRGALVLFLVGYIKKACLADGVAGFVDQYFGQPASYSPLGAWIAVLLYTVQIYCDFSGYTDMAIASARLLGYELTLNFNFPYLAQNIADFWHRWHISLSTWLRDYLYIPLGGNRGPRWFVFRNIMLTMLLGGLWHGAAWTFVLWGAMHGLALAVHRLWREKATCQPLLAGFMAWLRWPLTLYFVCLAWVLFRATDLGQAGVVMRAFVLGRGNGTRDLPVWLLGVVLIFGLLHWLNARGEFARWWRRGPDPLFAAGYGCVVAGVLLFVPTHYTPFIYFQF
ncbi:MAG TPA: MBOAT family O-acyltransferase [Chthoniobacterales bacterium]|jgi:alginate O-acetyltransferase complex protein AlgI